MRDEVLTKDQLSVIQEHRQEEASRLQLQLQDKLIKRLDEKIAPRVVTRMLKVRLANEEKQLNRSAILTVWNPSDDVLSLLTEGNILTFHSLTASGYSRYGDLQLTSSRQTRYSLHRHSVLPRQVTPLSALNDAGYMPQFSEVDVVGLVLPRSDVAEDSRLIYISDANYNFLGISFCMDIKEDTRPVRKVSDLYLHTDYYRTGLLSSQTGYEDVTDALLRSSPKICCALLSQ
ncbi:Breast cancer 2, early onset [Homalodisca vitripennis]|nr:Breast cancer 2, early onset [Homalodisca vitripennis]